MYLPHNGEILNFYSKLYKLFFLIQLLYHNFLHSPLLPELYQYNLQYQFFHKELKELYYFLMQILTIDLATELG